MMKFLILLFAIGSVSCASWASLARFENHADYFLKLMQETILEVERKEWCNLKLLDLKQTLNEKMYSWLVSGTVSYTNGFVVSIQEIDITNIKQSFYDQVVNNTRVQLTGTMRGELNLRNVKIGYDVTVDLTGEGTQRYTGVFTHTKITLDCSITKDILTNQLTTSTTVSSVSGGLDKMIYMPANNVTEVLSRKYIAGEVWDGISSIWGKQMIAPAMLTAANKIEFPKICFSC